MAEKRLVIGIGDSNCAGAVAASSLSATVPHPGIPDIATINLSAHLAEQTQLKIWNYEPGQQEWENYNIFSANTHWESAVVGPEFPLRWLASGYWGRRVKKLSPGTIPVAGEVSASLPSGVDVHLFKGSKYQTSLLKWDNTLDFFGNPNAGGIDYASLWPLTKDSNFLTIPSPNAKYGLFNQLSAAVADLSAAGTNTVVVDGMYVVMGTLDAIAPYGSRAYRGLLVDFVTNIYDVLEEFGCTLNNFDYRRTRPTTVLVGTHDQYDHGTRVGEEERFNTIRTSTYNASIDLNLLGKTDTYFLPTTGTETVWNYFTSAGGTPNAVYSVAEDKVHYDLSGAFNLGAAISNIIYPLSSLPLPSPTLQSQTATTSESNMTGTAPGATFAATEGTTAGKIGIPTVKSYGSSYGIYKGNRLGDYKTPRPDDLNNKDAKDTVEFRDFDRTVKDYVLAKLGYPVVDVELEDFQLNVCIDEAISRLEYHAPDWMTQYATFEVTGGINVYEIPQVVADNLTDVWYKRDFFKFGASPGSLEYDFAIMFFTNTGLFNNYNVSQYLLMQQYLKQVKNVLGQMSTWQLVNNKYLHIFPIPESSKESVLLEFKAFDPKTIHHAYKSWIQRYSLCIAKEILGGIRSKYQTLPGPGGGTSLNGEALIQEATQEKERLIEELLTEIEEAPLFDIL